MRGIARLAALAAVGCVVVPAAGSGASIAGIQDDVIAVAPLDQIPERARLVASTRARVARVDLLWSEIAPTKPRNAANHLDPAYDWTRADAIISSLLARKIRPLISVYSFPSWSSKKTAPADTAPVHPFFPRPVDFGIFMGAIAKRYNGRTVIPGLNKRLEVRHWELGNECNLRRYCRPQYRKGKPNSPRMYAALVKAAVPRIMRANRRAIPIVGATGPKGRSDRTGIGTIPWIRSLRGSRRYIKAYSQHIYPAAAPLSRSKAIPNWNTVPRLFSELDRIRKGLPMYITEAGYTTRRTPFRKVRVTEAQQRTYLRQIFTRLRVTKSKRIPLVIWFNLQDNEFWPGGLIRANGTKKPSFATFRSIARHGALLNHLRP